MRAYFYIVVAVLAWGVEYPLMKRCTETVGLLATGAVLFSVSAVLLGITLLVQQRMRPSAHTPRRGAPPYAPLALISGIGIVINVLALLAINLTSVVNASTLARADVLFSLPLAVLIFREPVAKWVYFFVPVMLAGICLLTGFFAQAHGLGQAGDLFALAGAFFMSLNAFIIRKAVQSTSGTTVGLCNSACIGTFFIVASFVASWGINPFRQIPGPVWLMLLALGGLAYLFFLFYYLALRTIPSWEALLMFLAVPAVAALCGWGWLREVPSMAQLAGMALVLTGATGIIIIRSLRSRAPVRPATT